MELPQNIDELLEKHNINCNSKINDKFKIFMEEYDDDMEFEEEELEFYWREFTEQLRLGY